MSSLLYVIRIQFSRVTLFIFLFMALWCRRVICRRESKHV